MDTQNLKIREHFATFYDMGTAYFSDRDGDHVLEATLYECEADLTLSYHNYNCTCSYSYSSNKPGLSEGEGWDRKHQRISKSIKGDRRLLNIDTDQGGIAAKNIYIAETYKKEPSLP